MHQLCTGWPLAAVPFQNDVAGSSPNMGQSWLMATIDSGLLKMVEFHVVVETTTNAARTYAVGAAYTNTA